MAPFEGDTNLQKGDFYIIYIIYVANIGDIIIRLKDIARESRIFTYYTLYFIEITLRQQTMSIRIYAAAATPKKNNQVTE